MRDVLAQSVEYTCLVRKRANCQLTVVEAERLRALERRLRSEFADRKEGGRREARKKAVRYGTNGEPVVTEDGGQEY